MLAGAAEDGAAEAAAEGAPVAAAAAAGLGAGLAAGFYRHEGRNFSVITAATEAALQLAVHF